jgi:hypothetical protein
MGKYGLAAVKAVELMHSEELNDPIDAWNVATGELFGIGSSGQFKGCPKGAFLGLCEEGLVKGIISGYYTRSYKNKSYAIKAVQLLKKNINKNYTEEDLWNEILSGELKSYNQQMDVVLSLWNNNLIE